MLENLTLEAILPIASAGIGFVFRMFADSRREIFEIAKERALLNQAAHDAAAKRSGAGGTWMRRAIYILIAFMFVSIVVAGFMEVPVIVEVERKVGWLFWRHTELFFETIQGVLFPVEIRQGFLALLGFYLGQGIK